MSPRHLLAAFLSLVILYELSVGPATFIYKGLPSTEKGGFEKMANVVYWPLEKLIDRYPAIAGAIDWYLSFWGGS
jgi:hypothetical protein